MGEVPNQVAATGESSAPRRRVAAVVVTYNRVELLLRCIRRLRAQNVASLMDILVIDNASTDGTRERVAALPREGLAYVNTGANLGGAGGFQYGMRRAVESGYEFVWVMDDDCMPGEGALEELLLWDEALGGDYGFLCSKVLWKDGSPCVMNVPRETLTRPVHSFEDNPIRVTMASFVSLFLRCETVTREGLPIKEFFIWSDDWEFTRRLSRQHPCFLITSSVVEHHCASNIGANIDTDSPERLGRYRYLYRNDVYLYRREGLRGLSYEAARLAYHTLRVLLRSRDHRMERLRMIARGTMEGLSFRPSIEYCQAPVGSGGGRKVPIRGEGVDAPASSGAGT